MRFRDLLEAQCERVKIIHPRLCRLLGTRLLCCFQSEYIR